MINGKKVIVVLIRHTMRRRPWRIRGGKSRPRWIPLCWWTIAAGTIPRRLAQELGIFTVVHEANTGYGGNQKTCYRTALSLGADIIVMVHPDYQYTPRLVTAMAAMIAYGEFDAVLASRILRYWSAQRRHAAVRIQLQTDF